MLRKYCIGVVLLGLYINGSALAHPEFDARCYKINKELQAAYSDYKVAERKVALNEDMLVNIGHVTSYVGGGAGDYHNA